MNSASKPNETQPEIATETKGEAITKTKTETSTETNTETVSRSQSGNLTKTEAEASTGIKPEVETTVFVLRHGSILGPGTKKSSCAAARGNVIVFLAHKQFLCRGPF
jgi:hypothetical protein